MSIKFKHDSKRLIFSVYFSRWCKQMTPEELKQLQATLWKSADDLRANSDLRSSEYSTPVLGLIFLKFSGQQISPM